MSWGSGGNRLTPFMAAGFGSLAASAWAQVAVVAPVVDPPGLEWVVVPLSDLTLRSGSREISVPGATSLRLSFEGTQLQAGATLHATSLADAAAQAIDAETLEQWSHTSAYFNGSDIQLHLNGTGEVHVPFVWAQFPNQPSTGFGERSLCGPDSRQPVTGGPVGRMLPAGCTAFIISDLNGSMLSAGHCAPTAGTVIQFNVPLSDSSGAIVHPGPEDQYVVEPTSVQMTFTGTGNDWSFFGVFPNSVTGLTPFQMQGERFTIANALTPIVGDQVVIAGFGSTLAPIVPQWNYALKSDIGPSVSLAGSTLRHGVDTTGGNSGSPIFSQRQQAVIGVHTHAGCTSTGGSNAGTAIQNSTLQNALRSPRGVCASGASSGAVGVGVLTAAGDLANNMGVLVPLAGSPGDVGSRFVANTIAPPFVEGLAYDGIEDAFWAVTSSALCTRIDAQSGSATVQGLIVGAAAPITGLAFDPSRRQLIGVSGSDGRLYDIDPTSLLATPIGPPRGGRIDALDFDPFSRTLFGLDDSSGRTTLIRIDRDSGSRTIIGTLGPTISDCNGLAFNPLDGQLYTVHTPSRDVLRVDANSGLATSLGVGNGMWDSSVGMAVRLPLPECAADVDFSGSPDSDDIVTFFTWWESGDVAADLTRDSGLDSDDVVLFFSAWDTGCP